MRSLSPLLLATSAALIALGLGCSPTEDSSSGARANKSSVGGDYTPVIAQVGDVAITQGYFDFRYEELSPGERARFSGEDWEQRFLDALIDEMLLSTAAEDENLHRERKTEWTLDKNRREILFARYYEKHFQDQLVVPEEELRAHYDEYQDKYTLLGRILVHHIQTSSAEKANEAYQKLQDGENFSVVAAQYSEDEMTKDKHGTLGWINPDGYVLGRGFDKEFTDYLFTLDATTVYAPKRFGDTWHVIKTGGKEPGQVQPFADARERVERELRPVLQREAFKERRDALAKSIGVERFGKFDVDEDRSAEELYRLAGESLNRYAKLDYYDALVENYPDDPRADDALFMAGFVASEELFSAGEAAGYFKRLMREYPDSEFRDDARFMLGNLAGAQPGLTEQGIPRNAEEAAGRIDGLGQ